jgi:hypothetical protein
MSKSENLNLAELLLTGTLKLLVERVKDGSATAADLAVAHKLVKDCGVQMLPTETNPMGKLMGALTDKLPFAGSDTPSH